MYPINRIMEFIVESLAESRERPQCWEAEAQQRGMTVEELQAEWIIASVVEMLAQRNSNRFILVNDGGEQFWTGSEFVPASVGQYAAQVQCFDSRKDARRAAAELWRERRIRVRPVGLPAAEPEQWQENAYKETVVILRASRRDLPRWEASARQRSVTVEEMEAAAITEMVAAVKRTGAVREFALMDCSGTFYWNIDHWLPIADEPFPPDVLQTVRSHKEAEQIAALLWRRDRIHVRVVQLK